MRAFFLLSSKDVKNKEELEASIFRNESVARGNVPGKPQLSRGRDLYPGRPPGSWPPWERTHKQATDRWKHGKQFIESKSTHLRTECGCAWSREEQHYWGQVWVAYWAILSRVWKINIIFAEKVGFSWNLGAIFFFILRWSVSELLWHGRVWFLVG